MFSLTTCNSFINDVKLVACKVIYRNQNFLGARPTLPVDTVNILALWLYGKATDSAICQLQ